MNDELRELASIVHRISGIVVRDEQLSSLRSALGRVDPTLTAGDVIGNPEPARLERLIDEVAIKETFLLRHIDELEEIDWVGAATRAGTCARPVRIWSAGCSTGEEAYSLAILAAEALDGRGSAIEVFGSDLLSSVLLRAQAGIYGPRSTRLVDDRRRQRWFVPDGDSLRVGDELRGLVRFGRHNMVRESSPPQGEAPFDVVVCRNVLIYFDRPTATGVTNALTAALGPGGQLLLGTIDRLFNWSAPLSGANRPPEDLARLRRTVPREPYRRLRPEPGPPRAAIVPGSARRASATEEADTAFETGSSALGAGDGPAAVSALRRALFLDPGRAVVALQLARAYESTGQIEAARGAYKRTLRLVGKMPDGEARLYDRVAAGDVAAACRTRLAALPDSHAPS
jgi:chemotaxis protein methyltransferase CheR